jgi:hypothetical protein
MQALKAVQLIAAVEKAKQRIPAEHRGPSYYGALDVWLYEQSDHPNMCEECGSYNLTNFAGSDLRGMFPYHEVIDENFIYPKVHPHCFCGLVRLYPVDAVNEEQTQDLFTVPAKTTTEPGTASGTDQATAGNEEVVQPQTFVVASSGNEKLSDSAVIKMLSLPENDFEDALTGMLSIGYIVAGAADFIRSLYRNQVKKIITKKENKQVADGTI